MDVLKWFYWICMFFILGGGNVLSAENQYNLVIQCEQNLKEFKIIEFQNFPSIEKRQQYLTSLIKGLQDKMYLEASIDSLWGTDEDTLWVSLNIGEKYSLNSELPDLLLKSKKNHQNDKPNNLSSTLLSIDNQLNYLQENGYPFAEIYWDSLQAEGKEFNMKAQLNKGPLILFDSLVNREKGKVAESFLKSYLGMKKEMPYRESFLKESDNLLKKLPFVKFTKPSTVNFHSDYATMSVYLAQRKVSKFDFIVGLLPNNESNGKMLITGEARLQLQNAFKRGEEIFFEWKRVKANSQKMNLKFNYPYILQSPIGVAGSFILDKRDSSYLDVNWTLGVPFRTKANNYIKGYLENTQTIVLKVDTQFIKRTMKLPNIQDVSGLLYGIEGYFENLDYLFNPRRGIEAGVNIQVGTRRLKPNNSIVNMGEMYSQLYDSVKIKSLQTQLKAQFSAYLPLTKRQVLKMGMMGASKTNAQILQNELYRIGGSKILRGFDEESIFAQHFVLATIEYRFILEQNSYFYTFFDAAWVSKKLEEKFSKDFPFGIGAGIAFETKAGIFGVSYAVGRQQSNPIDFRTSKIHFGYVNIF